MNKEEIIKYCLTLEDIKVDIMLLLYFLFINLRQINYNVI